LPSTHVGSEKGSPSQQMSLEGQDRLPQVVIPLPLPEPVMLPLLADPLPLVAEMLPLVPVPVPVPVMLPLLADPLPLDAPMLPLVAEPLPEPLPSDSVTESR
jgi:hypothetical protein